MANHYKLHAAGVAANKRQPMFLPGFDRGTQLGMQFNTISFTTAWLRKTYTNGHSRSIHARLASEHCSRHERLLQEVRYGNNISLLFKACYTFRDSHRSGALWQAVGRVFGVNAQVVESVANIFVEARGVYLSNHPAGRRAAHEQLRTTATYWVDNWCLFISGREDGRPPSCPDVFTAVDDLFRREEQTPHGDLAHVLSTTQTDCAPPTAPRGPRKRSPSPSPLEFTPDPKKRTFSTSSDRTTPQESPVDYRGKEEPRDSVVSTDARRQADDQPDLGKGDRPCLQFKIRSQAQEKAHDWTGYQEQRSPTAGEYDTLVRYNIELQNRVACLERERLDSLRAQKDRDHAIRMLQMQFAAFEQTSPAANTHSPVNDTLVQRVQDMTEKLEYQGETLRNVEQQLDISDKLNDKLVQNMQEMTKKLEMQAERLQKMDERLEVGRVVNDKFISKIQEMTEELGTQGEKLCKTDGRLDVSDHTMLGIQSAISSLQTDLTEKTQPQEMTKKLEAEAEKLRKVEKRLEFSDQAAQSMQCSISSLQRDLTERTQPSGAATEIKTRQERDLETHRREFPKVLARVAALEVQNVCLSDLQRNFQVLKAQNAAQKDKTAALALASDNELENCNQQAMITLRSIEQAMEKHSQTLQGVVDRVVTLENQAPELKDQITSLERANMSRAAAIPPLRSEITRLDQTQVDNLKMLDGRLEQMRKDVEQQRQEDADSLLEKLTELGNLAQVKSSIAELQTKMAYMEEHRTEVTKRLDATRVSQDALTSGFEDHSARIDTLSQSIRTLPFSLAKADGTRFAAFRSELQALYQKQTVASQQQANQSARANDVMLQSLSDRVAKLDHSYETHVAECQERLGQVHEETKNIVRASGKHDDSEVRAVVRSLCNRVGIMENGFQVMRDIVPSRGR
jgi:hypothetical protein